MGHLLDAGGPAHQHGDVPGNTGVALPIVGARTEDAGDAGPMLPVGAVAERDGEGTVAVGEVDVVLQVLVVKLKAIVQDADLHVLRAGRQRPGFWELDHPVRPVVPCWWVRGPA